MKKLCLLFVGIILSASISAKDFSDCSNLFYKPLIVTQSDTIQLCNTNFATLYSTKTKTPVFSYENNSGVAHIKRIGEFHEDTRIPLIYRSTNHDYYKSGYDKGHIAPSGDMINYDTQQESFLLSNIAPQNPKKNRSTWRILESKVRGTKYIVTGVLFQGTDIKTIGHGVNIPTQFYKIASDGKCTNAYIIDNNDTAKLKRISLSELNVLTGIDFQLPDNDCKLN